MPFLRYQISLFLRLDCQPIRVDRRVRPKRHLLDPTTRQPRTISHRCRRGPVLPSPRPCTRRCTLNLTSLLHADLLHHLQPRVRPSRQVLPPALPPARHYGAVVRKIPTQAADESTYVPLLAVGALASTLRRAPMRCTRRSQSAASPPAGPWSTPDQKLLLTCAGHCHPACVLFLVDKVVSAEDFRFHRASPLQGKPRPALRAPRRPSVPAARIAHRCNPWSSISCVGFLVKTVLHLQSATQMYSLTLSLICPLIGFQ